MKMGDKSRLHRVKYQGARTPGSGNRSALPGFDDHGSDRPFAPNILGRDDTGHGSRALEGAPRPGDPPTQPPRENAPDGVHGGTDPAHPSQDDRTAPPRPGPQAEGQ